MSIFVMFVNMLYISEPLNTGAMTSACKTCAPCLREAKMASTTINDLNDASVLVLSCQAIFSIKY